MSSLRFAFFTIFVLWIQSSLLSTALTQVPAESTSDLPLRRISGDHVTIFTDLPSSADIDELSVVFDQAVPQWCEYFGVPLDAVRGWRLEAYLIVSKERFVRSGLLPKSLPPFLNGYQRGNKMWIYAQPGAYYTRHLVLHEGTHGFMFNHLGPYGAPWYTEGIAELFGTHRWENGKLQMRVTPDSKADFPYWGRIGILQNDRQLGNLQTIENLLRLPPSAFRNNRAYAWSWGLVAMLDSHPRFRERFRMLGKHMHKDAAAFSSTFKNTFKRDMRMVHDAWSLFTANVDYGYEVHQDVVRYSTTKRLEKKNNRVTIETDAPWQSSGFRVVRGKRYRIAARGRFVVRKEPDVWWCEPGGVTIEYYRGQPLGILQAAILPNGSERNQTGGEKEKAGFMSPIAVGLRSEFVAPASGDLFFRINEMPGELSDNHGDLTVSVKPVASG